MCGATRLGKQAAAGSAGEGTHPGRGPHDVQIFGNQVASLRADGRARPPRTEGTEGSPRLVGHGGSGGAQTAARGQPPQFDTHHARGPRGIARAPAAPTAEPGAGRASSRSPPPPPLPPGQIHMGRGSPQRSPYFLLPPPIRCSRPRAAPRNSGLMPSLPPPLINRSRAAASAAARSSETNFLGCTVKQPRVSFRLSLLLPPQAPPPVAAAELRRLRHPGVSRRKKRRPELRAEGSTTSLQMSPPPPHPRPPAAPYPRRVPTRLNAVDSGAPSRAWPC